MTIIPDLIKRLEQCTGPDRELDAEIARLDGWTQPANNSGAWAKDYGGDVGVRWLISAPEFTASVDAALTLVPKGWEGEIFWHYGNSERLGYVELKEPNPLWDSSDCPTEELNRYASFAFSYDDECDRHTDESKPLPICIALVIAALKARQPEQKGERK